MPLWWNWQTRGTQNPVVAIPCRFDPDQRHQQKSIGSLRYFFYRRRSKTEPKDRGFPEHILSNTSVFRKTAIPDRRRGIVIFLSKQKKLKISRFPIDFT